jgi:hypothetical protein
MARQNIQKILLSLWSLVYLYKNEVTIMMTDKKKYLNKLLNTRVLTSCILSIILGVTQSALSAYQPPKDQKPPSGYSDSSGIRGSCKTTSERLLILLFILLIVPLFIIGDRFLL